MKRQNKISVLGVLLLMTGLVLAQVPVSAADGQNQVPVSAIDEQNQLVCVQFTKNGEKLGNIDCTDKANDLHVVFHGRGVVQFTKDGKNVGDPQKSPPGANDFTVKWDPLTGQIKEFIWTKDGKPVGKAKVPRGANDFHFKAGKIVSAIWTKDGRRLNKIVVPKGANDLEWSLGDHT